MTPFAANRGRDAGRWIFGIQGALLAIGSLVIGLVGWLVLGLLADVAADLRAEAGFVDSTATWILDRRHLLLVPALAGAGCGVALLSARRWRWPLLLVGTVLCLLVFATVLGCFLLLIAPLYDVSSLES